MTDYVGEYVAPCAPAELPICQPCAEKAWGEAAAAWFRGGAGLRRTCAVCGTHGVMTRDLEVRVV